MASENQMKLAKFKELCEDIDNERNGYISTKMFLNVLSVLPKSRKMEESDIQWLQSNSSIKGKVNYRHVFKKLNLFKTPSAAGGQHQQLNNSSMNKHSKEEYSPFERRQMLMRSDQELYQHPNDSKLEHFYKKNTMEYPPYEYSGNGSFKVTGQNFNKNALNTTVINQRNYNHSVGQRNLWMASGYTTTNGQQMQHQDSFQKDKMDQIIGEFKDKIPIYDLRRMYNLRQFLIQKQTNNLLIVNSEEILSNMKRILSNQVAFDLILSHIRQDDSLSLKKLDLLILRFEETRTYKSYSKDDKYIATIKNQNSLGGDLKKQLLYLHTLFDLKFKSFHHAFQFFDLNKKGYITQNEWLRGLREIGQDCILDREAVQIFQYLDKNQNGQVSNEEFKDILVFQRKLGPNRAQSSTSRNFNTLNGSSANINNMTLDNTQNSRNDFTSTELQFYKHRQQGNPLKNCTTAFGKKAVRSESIDNIINHVPNHQFCTQIKQRREEYLTLHQSNRKKQFGFKEYKVNKAFQMRNQRNQLKVEKLEDSYQTNQSYIISEGKIRAINPKSQITLQSKAKESL